MRAGVCTVAIAWLGACGFRHGALSTASDGGDAGESDAPDAYQGTWLYRKPITILGSKVRNGPHVRFVALIAWDADNALAQHARSDGHDIRFVSTDGTTVLPYERTTYDAATGALEAWVRVDSIQASTDTQIYIEYGNDIAPDQQDPDATWPPNVIGAWHLEDGTDSSGNANTAQAVNGATVASKGKVGHGASFDGVDDRLLMADSTSLDSVAGQATISGWFYFQDATGPTRQFLMASSNDITPPKSSFEWAVGTNGDAYFYPCRGDGDVAYNLVTNPFTSGAWHHAAIKLDFTNKAVDFFVDGLAIALTTNNVPSMWMNIANPDDWLWGSHPLYTAPFYGYMDELRVTAALRGAGWIATEFSNQNDPTAFIRVDPEELLP